MPFNLNATIRELARRAKIGNGLAYHHAVRVMKERQQRIGGSNVPQR